MAQKFTLSARSALMANIGATDTSLLVEVSKADLFPIANTGTDPIPTAGKDWFKVILEDTSYNKEVVYVRTRTLGSASFTDILRGQEGTTARAFLAGGTIVGLRQTAIDLEGAISFASGASTFWKNLVGAVNAALSRAGLGAGVVGDALFTSADAPSARTTLGLGTAAVGDIGVQVQGYDGATAKTNAAQQFTAPQRTQPLTDNDLSFDLSAKQDFVCTPTAGGTLTFTNITAGCKGEILLVNGSNYTIAKAATVKCPGTMLATISATGRYRLAYSCLDGTNVDVTASGALA